MVRTVQLKDDTYEALKGYKIGGMTFDDVVRRLMEGQSPETFHEEYRKWQAQVLERMKRSGDYEAL